MANDEIRTSRFTLRNGYPMPIFVGIYYTAPRRHLNTVPRALTAPGVPVAACVLLSK